MWSNKENKLENLTDTNVLGNVISMNYELPFG